MVSKLTMTKLFQDQTTPKLTHETLNIGEEFILNSTKFNNIKFNWEKLNDNYKYIHNFEKKK